MAHENSESDGRFMQVLTQYQRNLLAFIVGLTPTLHDADDILQEVNLALWKKRHLYDWDQDFLRWAFAFAGIEVRRFRDRLASQKVWASDTLMDSLADEYPQDLQVAEERREALSCCMQKLGSTEHQFITEFYGKQQSVQNLASTSGRPASTVYKILTRARRALRECVERHVAQQTRQV